ncbi:argininosuccinate lyase [Streptomyces tropicalis]|uniref:argininosuccinate lyase n=1 Tax=Streptomyces tropicalis TaxID=3034234 RepID=A0ABT6A4D9_9ACTN|nr:lyase family protein [Streptomyces tropicalis]MDF3299504.1 lyase family protein [Streptomyces tropicalis]
MTSQSPPPAAELTGRISGGPNQLLHDEVLAPQFRFESRHLLPHYVAVEKALTAEYARMGLLTADEAHTVAALLDGVGPDTLAPRPDANMSDIAFALERHVEAGLPRPAVRWHVDRSRNDLQSCAQVMFGRDRLTRFAAALLELGDVVLRRAQETRHLPMPGYTHFQAAQVITPGFHLAALSEHLLHTQRRLLHAHDGIDACPLGAGAMAGQELPWDRDRMARLLGFAGPQPHALTAVASRRWSAEATAELSLLGAALSRFTTDLLTWGGSEYGFVELPDELSGISSAMPQKRNYPVLERIRGRTAHLTAFHTDVLLGQRNTPFCNLVEVSKEAGTHVLAAFDSAHGTVRLLTEVLRRLTFRAERMRAVCEREFLGGFALANALTLTEDVPWRTAQVVAGKYIVRADAAGAPPYPGVPELLVEAAAAHGHALTDPAGLLADAFDVDRGLARLASAGSAHPEAVGAVLDAQRAAQAEVRAAWARRAEAVDAGAAETDRALGLRPEPAPATAVPASRAAATAGDLAGGPAGTGER